MILIKKVPFLESKFYLKDKNFVKNLENRIQQNFEKLFLTRQGGSPILWGKMRSDAFILKSFNFSTDNTSQVSHATLNFVKINVYWVRAQTWRTLCADEIDYALNLGTKLEFIRYFNAKQLGHSETTLLQNQCGHRRTQILTFLMLAMQNTRLAGSMLTGDQSF